MFNRVFLIVIDGLGIGAAHDAHLYGDENTNTLLHVTENINYEFKNLKKLGLYNLLNKSNDNTLGYHTISSFKGQGKSSIVGHYEMMGIETKEAYNTFEDGFPQELIARIEEETNRKVIGNKRSDGIQIIEELGEQQMKEGSLIVYTSVDSVLQIAVEKYVIKLDELYEICRKVKEITNEKEEWKIARVIARPFIKQPKEYIRTSERRDFTTKPPKKTMLNNLKNLTYTTVAIGKIGDMFNNYGVTKLIRTTDNLDGMNRIVETMKSDIHGLCFANLSDTDSLYGHRRDLQGYAKCLKQFDDYLPIIVNTSRESDLIIITGDHGNDPTHEGYDHTRENVPVFIYSKRFVNSGRLDNFETIADIAATIGEIFDTNQSEIGTSFLNKL